MFESPKIPDIYDHQSSSTPLNTQTTSKLKSYSYKQLNHSKLRNQTSPYYSPNQHQHQYHASSYTISINQSIISNINRNTEDHDQTSTQDLSSSYSEENQSTKTNPPTTPISSLFTTSAETSLSLNSSPSISSVRKQDIKSQGTSSTSSIQSDILFVTPATSTSPSSKQTTASVSSAQTTYSRSSSLTSLNSFDVKSTHSSVQSEYSASNTHGFMTPACYSDLPDSPGETFYFPKSNNQTILQNQNFHVNNFSIMTVDSNPSKSNDITIVERTVLANNHQFGGSDSVGSSGKKLVYLTEPFEDEDERVITYDVEGSLCETRSTRSNVSCLTFPNEPTADLTFIRNLLEKKSTLTPLTSNLTLNKPSSVLKQLWSSNSSFTPPVKLQVNIKLGNNSDQHLSRSLFNTLEDEDDKDSCKLFTHDDEDDRHSLASMASVPSIIRNDMSNNQVNSKSNFSELFGRLKPSNTEDSECSSKANSPVNWGTRRCSLNNSQVMLNDESFKQARGVAEEEDDQKILYEFIDECYKNYNTTLNEEDIQEEDEEEDEDDEDEDEDDFKLDETNPDPNFIQHQYYNPLKQESESLLSRILPKIEEEENECENSRLELVVNKKLVSNKKMSKLSSTSSISSLGSTGSKPVVVQMTKTAMLRANKLKEAKKSSSTVSQVKRPAPKLVKENQSDKKCVSSTSSTSNSKPIKFNSSTNTNKKMLINTNTNTKQNSVLTSLNLHSNQFNKN